MPFPPLPREYELDTKQTQESLVSLTQANFKALFTYLQRLRELSFDETLTNIVEGSVIVQEIVIAAFQDSATIDFNYANNILTASVRELSIQTVHLANSSVTEAKLADLSVSTAKIQLLAITTALLQDLAVTTAKLQDLAVTEAKLAALSVATAKLQNQAVTYAKIQDVSAASRLLLRGSAAGAGSVQEGTLGAGLSLTGIVLDTAVVTASGTYTPTLTNVANLDASTAFVSQYLRVGSSVTVSGKIEIDPTLAATVTQLGISLPIASAFTQQEQCAGTAFASGIAGQGAAIRADATNDRAELVFISGDITNQAMYFTFTYRIL